MRSPAPLVVGCFAAAVVVGADSWRTAAVALAAAAAVAATRIRFAPCAAAALLAVVAVLAIAGAGATHDERPSQPRTGAAD